MQSSRISLLLALGAAACGNATDGSHGNGPDAGASDGGSTDGTASSLPECKAQRAIFLLAGNGGFGWFTLAWPLPAVIQGFQSTYAYDDPTQVKDETASADHPLFARKVGTAGIWDGEGSAPQPSAFIAGVNESHTTTPTSILVSPDNTGVAAAGAAMQASLKPVLPVIAFSPATMSGTATGAPAELVVADVPGAVAAFDSSIPANIQAQLTPTADQMTRYLPVAQPAAVEVALASKLAFTANAFKLGVVGTVLASAYNDDPHSAFASGEVPGRATDLAVMLDAFYTDLAAANDPQCSHAGRPISLADNTVMIVVGDTPKNSFVASGWPDGTTDDANWIYLRSNGFTPPGWFGQLTSTARVNFSPTTGLVDATAATAAATAAAFAGTLFAIARGDKTVVATFTSAPYAGVISPIAP